MVGIRSIVAGVVLVASAVAIAQTWTVTTANFESLQGEIRAADAAGVRIQAGDTERALPWEQVVSVEQPGVKMALGADPFVLVTRDGQRIAGSPVRLGDEKLAWRSQMLGAMELPIEEVAGIVQLSSEILPEGAGQEDLVVLANGDELRGIIEADADGGIQVQQQGKAAKVQWNNVKAIVLAQVSPTSRPADAGTGAGGKLKIRLADGSVCLVQKLHLDGKQLHLERPAGELRLPLAAVVSVENLGGKVHFLAGMRPKEGRYAPYVRFTDESAAGVKVLPQVTVGDRTYRDVIQARPRTVLTYVSDVNGKLHLRYACNDAGPMTDMAVRVLVNGKAVHERGSVASAALSEAVEAPVKAGDEVSIEVDYGKNFDVQDWLLLLEAAFVAQ